MRGTRPLRAYAEVALGRQRSPQQENGPFMVPYLRAANVNDGHLNLDSVHAMNFTPEEQRIFSLKSGDVLVTEGSGSLSAVGASAVWSGEISGTVCFQNTLLRLRPRPGTDPRYLAWWCRYAFSDGLFESVATGANIYHLSAERVRALPMVSLEMDQQRAIADYLDARISRIVELDRAHSELWTRINERLDARLKWIVGETALARRDGQGSVPLKRVLRKLQRAAGSGDMVTAFRDGQVTRRSSRRSDGYTDAWVEGSTLQLVTAGDVVVHGLDGFAGDVFLTLR